MSIGRFPGICRECGCDPDAIFTYAARTPLELAAPDLLKAVKAMHAAFNAPLPIPRGKGDALEAMCRAAIAKATVGSAHTPGQDA